jgi:hypothetical protein
MFEKRSIFKISNLKHCGRNVRHTQIHRHRNVDPGHGNLRALTNGWSEGSAWSMDKVPNTFPERVGAVRNGIGSNLLAGEMVRGVFEHGQLHCHRCSL